MSDGTRLERRQRLDRIIHSVFAALHDIDGYCYDPRNVHGHCHDPSPGMIGSLAAIVERECQAVGLRVSLRDVLERVSDCAFNTDDKDTPCSVH